MKIANVLVSDSWGEVTPDALNRGIGGREGAMIYLSREWAKLGHHVTNFVNVDKPTRFDEATPESLMNPMYRGIDLRGYHEYVPLNVAGAVLAHFPHDVVIAWECPSLFANPVISNNAKLKICEMQVGAFVNDGEREAAELYCDFVAALSPWHKGLLLHQGLRMNPDSVVVFPNGVDIERYPKEIFEKKIKTVPGDNPVFIYSSSPDRGLLPLLESWPYIKHNFPGATLKVAYGVKKWTEHVKWAHGKQGEMATQIDVLMNQDGVEDLGKIGQDELSKLQFEADAWLYPLDAIQPTETGCITAVENAAAGNPIITTNCDCMEEEFGDVGVIANLPFDAKGFADCVSYVLPQQEVVESIRVQARKFAESRDWRNIAGKWDRFFKEQVNG